MDRFTLIVFALVYIGMIVGKYPGLAMDRTGMALLGAIALIVAGRVGEADAWAAIDVPTIILLLGLMVVSSQLRLGGFYTFVTRKIASANLTPSAFLALVIASMAALAAVLTNDVICLAVTPVLLEGCSRRNLNPVPYLLALACASNIGSAATLIGNPQNMLIGQALNLSFAGYLFDAAIPSALGLIVVWVVIVLHTRGRWHAETPIPEYEAQPFDSWQSAKGLAAILALILVFLFTDWPRDIVALGAAGFLLLSRRMASRTIMGLVDWHLLLLFMGLFVVNHAVETTGILPKIVEALRVRAIDIEQPAWLFIVTVVLSNLVSNVPAAMLLLPSATHESAGPILALASTLAGNLFIVGSIANIIVVEQAARYGTRITWQEHARIGLPVTVITLAIAAAWLWLIG
ncbi:MAG TPA: anion transporter [Candidatus Hydrogenedentes bacterium]|nr:anion transporter [Candidatus Hydrogenedentota bacterium]